MRLHVHWRRVIHWGMGPLKEELSPGCGKLATFGVIPTHSQHLPQRLD